MNKESVIVTAGGTREPIDDVRFITNFSTGRFGHALANELAKRDCQVHILCPEDVPLMAGYKIDKASYQSFTSAESLHRTLLTQPHADIVIHAAAVSDYTPLKTSGKISSDQDSLTIQCVKTPKILPKLRDHFGKQSFLVGFKLLSGASRQELIDKAFTQAENAHLNLTVANDLKQINPQTGVHPVILVTREGGAIDLVGTKEEVANNLADFILKRSRVHWYDMQPSATLPHFTDLPLDDQSKFANLLEFAQSSNLLFDTSGNVSLRSGDHIIVTPSKADKRFVSLENAVVAQVDHTHRSIVYQGQENPSIDTGVSDYLYRKFPDLKYLLHFHRPWGRADVKTTFPYPCGVVEEAFEIEEQLKGKRSYPEGFVVDLVHHGFLVGLPEGGLERLAQSWHDSWQAFENHLTDVDAEFAKNQGFFRPIFSGPRAVGVFGEYAQGGAAFLQKSAQRGFTGPRIMEQLKQRRMSILTVNECQVMDRYLQVYGFSKGKVIDGRIIQLNPPEVTGSDPLFQGGQLWKEQIN